MIHNSRDYKDGDEEDQVLEHDFAEEYIDDSSFNDRAAFSNKEQVAIKIICT